MRSQHGAIRFIGAVATALALLVGTSGIASASAPTSNSSSAWHFRGVWKAKVTYTAGSVVRRNAAVWLAIRDIKRGAKPEWRRAGWVKLVTDGRAGATGTAGAPGAAGAAGSTGASGSTGAAGAAGAQGPAGAAGASGTAGPQGPAGQVRAFVSYASGNNLLGEVDTSSAGSLAPFIVITTDTATANYTVSGQIPVTAFSAGGYVQCVVEVEVPALPNSGQWMSPTWYWVAPTSSTLPVATAVEYVTAGSSATLTLQGSLSAMTDTYSPWTGSIPAPITFSIRCRAQSSDVWFDTRGVRSVGAGDSGDFGGIAANSLMLVVTQVNETVVTMLG